MTEQSIEKPLSEEDAADFLHVEPRTLARWRRSGAGPNHSRVGRKALYTVADLDAFLKARRSDGLAV